MTGFQLTRPKMGGRAGVRTRSETDTRSRLPGRHASTTRARLSMRRLFYLARHAAR